MKRRQNSRHKPAEGVLRPRISRRHFLGGIIGIGTATALGLVPEARRPDRLSAHEAAFYKPHGLAD